MQSATTFLTHLNTTYAKLQKTFEELFWVSRMGDHSVDARMDKAQSALDAFRSDEKLLNTTRSFVAHADTQTRERLNTWIRFFECYQSPAELLKLKQRIDTLESKVLKDRSQRKEGYIDPYTKRFVKASSNKMASMVRTHPDEKIRKACFEAREKLAVLQIDDYVTMVNMRNDYAQALGYDDFYDFKLRRQEGFTKKELFSIFDDIYEKTRYAFKDIRALEKKMPGLRKPWNFAYMMSGDFTAEEDPYLPFSDALMRWGRSFAALGADFKSGTLTLDLLDREGKWNNGFCHWPRLVQFEKNKRIPGAASFTCNVVVGQVGSASEGYDTLFHEGGHALHLLNTEEHDVALNHEYAPMTVSWAETQSMFFDSVYSSIEWKNRYATGKDGSPYPFDLFERRVRKLSLIQPHSLHGIMFVVEYERHIYETKNLTKEKVISIAKKMYKKYFDRSGDSLHALNIPHIYSWEISAYYHGYGLAQLAVAQWREYFYKKYGHIVDNPRIAKEMTTVWKYGSRHSFQKFVELATGKKLSPKAYLDTITVTPAKKIAQAKKRIARLEQVPRRTKPIKLNAHIRMVDGKKVIADNTKSFEDMAEKYGKWLQAKK